PTRHLAHERTANEARAVGANAVVGIETRTMRFQGVHEMLMLGTASTHPALAEQMSLSSPDSTLHSEGQPANAPHVVYPMQPVTSDLTNEEMWNLIHIGYMPLKLVLGTAVYSLGVVSGLKAALSSMTL